MIFFHHFYLLLISYFKAFLTHDSIDLYSDPIYTSPGFNLLLSAQARSQGAIGRAKPPFIEPPSDFPMFFKHRASLNKQTFQDEHFPKVPNINHYTT